MNTNPSLPVMAKDWIVITRRISFEEKGFAFELRCEMWLTGPMVDNGGYPTGLTSVERGLFEKVSHLFTLAGGRWFYEPDEEAKDRQRLYREQQADRARKSVEARAKKNKNVDNQIIEEKNGSAVVQPPLEPVLKPSFSGGSAGAIATDSTNGEQVFNHIGNGNGNGIGKGKENGIVKKKKPPAQKVLFRDSAFFEFSAFLMGFAGIPDYENANFKHYYDSALNWSDSKGEKKVDWIATVKNWMNRDILENKFITKNYVNGTSAPKRTTAVSISATAGKAIEFD